MDAGLVNFDGLGIGLESAIVVTYTLEAVSLTQIAKTVLWSDRDDDTEVRKGFVPLLLENENLTPSYIGFNVPWILEDSLRKSPQSPSVVVNTSVGNREDNKNGLSIVRAYLNQLVQVSDGFLWLTII